MCLDPEKVAKRKRDFLEAFEKTGNVSAACRAASIPRSTINEYRRRDGQFAIDWDIAFQNAVDSLEMEAWRRARDGVDKPIYQGGQLVGSVTEYSDTLLTFLLRGHRSEIFNPPTQTQLTGPGGTPFFESLMQNLATVYGNGDRDLDLPDHLPNDQGFALSSDDHVDREIESLLPLPLSSPSPSDPDFDSD